MAQNKPQQFYLLPKILNGGIAGMIGVACVFPLDLVKTRLQNQQLGPNGEKMYRSMVDCFVKTFRSEGLRGMYHGSVVNILLVTPAKAINLASNDLFRYHLTHPDGKLPLINQMFAGGLAGGAQIIVVTPMELLKIQLQDFGRINAAAKLSGKPVERISAARITLNLLKEKGIFGLYRGLGACGLRDVNFSMVYFPIFAALNQKGPRRQDGSGDAVFWCSFLSGLAGGSFAALIVTPFDVMKTRLQALKTAQGEKEFSGIKDCIFKTYKYEGLTAFFKGGLCRMIVIAPLYGIAQTVYFLGVGETILGYDKTSS